MLAMTRFTGMVLVLICTMSLFVSASGAEGLISYSGLYAIDLEQKQMLLGSISEDALRIEGEVKDIINKTKSIRDEMISHLSIDKINLAEIVPVPQRLSVALPQMSNTLAPESTTRVQAHEKKKTL